MITRPYRQIERRKSRKIRVGNVFVGGDAPITVQTMTNTKTTDIDATLEQINSTVEAGVDIVRVSCPDKESTLALKEIIKSSHGLLTTIAYQVEGEKPLYALEGSVPIAGAAVQWLRDNLNIIIQSKDIESLAMMEKDNGGVYFVPAFSGLFSPYWDETARGSLFGLTRFSNKSHIARSVLESVAFQTFELLKSMEKDLICS